MQMKHNIRRFLRRGFMENVACSIIGIGIVMLMQPVAMIAFTYSFSVILFGTVGFLIVSHFPE
ncbi:hypothetical protein TUMSATVNIG2_24140 [Vibrio nigripulchritudo]|nr:hypothetical protein TUMSATVNIG2_24140 [Vibrio nigripulchritudo]